MNPTLQGIKQRFGIIGRSDLLDRALDTAVRVANTELSVLITGESGVGKEVFSKIIHQLSARKHNNFIAVNCGAIPSGTINSELFGHEKGAFTGATQDRKGYFETVDGGTIFLDEIGDMPLDTQAFLLRVLESGEFLRVGSSKVLTTDVRIVAATNVDLIEKVRKGKFREDLYYRLNTVPIHLPPLRERPEDIPILFRKFCVDFAEKYRTTPIQLDSQANLIIQNYSWPGNIRELRNVAEQMSVILEEKMITADIIADEFPQLLNRNLPSLTGPAGKEETSFQEREILYKLLFEMKADLNDLKGLVFELIKDNDLHVPNTQAMKALSAPSYPTYPSESKIPDFGHQEQEYHQDHDYSSGRPIILPSEDHPYNKTEVVDESLSLVDMEKEMIKKALKKHNGRRKEAADDLGISERTLYRKIKEYEIEA
jgi:DNA-binding NtrC family response regulator